MDKAAVEKMRQEKVADGMAWIRQSKRCKLSDHMPMGERIANCKGTGSLGGCFG